MLGCSAATGTSAMTKILVAEDEQDIRELVVDTLFDRGYDVLEARDGREAVQIAKREEIDLILIDVMMPGMDGFEAVKILQDNTLTQRIPVVMLTAMGALQGEQAAKELGVKHYISKAFQADVLQATVRVAIREAQSGEEETGQSRKVWGGSTLFHSNADGGGSNNLISLGSQLAPVDKKLDGGIRLGTLFFIEGPSATGKSLICQYAATGALDAGHSVAYFTSRGQESGATGKLDRVGLERGHQVGKTRCLPRTTTGYRPRLRAFTCRSGCGYGAGPTQT